MAETALKLGPRFFVMAKKKNLVRLRIKDEGEPIISNIPTIPMPSSNIGSTIRRPENPLNE